MFHLFPVGVDLVLSANLSSLTTAVFFRRRTADFLALNGTWMVSVAVLVINVESPKCLSPAPGRSPKTESLLLREIQSVASFLKNCQNVRN